jgi:bidirectional [NiFe] hydrogenase diaphorase subunit
VNVEELHALAAAERQALAQLGRRILVCEDSGCRATGSPAIRQALNAAAKAPRTSVHIEPTSCCGLCSRGPIVISQPDGTIFADVTVEQVASLVDGAAAMVGQPATALPADLPFLARQARVVMANAGVIDPLRIESYVGTGGYQALARVLNELTPAQVVDEIAASGLRGRGGAGFPTSVKWGLVARAGADQKYVICNGDEGDPGAFMDRAVMEGDPHRVLEGMAIAGYAVGATQGYVYVRGEYPLAIQRLAAAIRQAERHGILGSRVLDSAFQFRVDLRIGAGAFVCGEETALLASIEGGRGLPRARPPYPAQSGLWGKPTLINNVETFANVAPIIQNGGAWYARLGTEKSKGTKIFALAGKIANTGLIEVPLGITLREIVFDIGGGIPNGRAFKAVQTGGPSGGCVPAEYLDMPIDYESLQNVGSILGSGGMIVMDDASCMVDVARFYMDFCMHESCGKCIPCRTGTVQASRILERITRGEGDLADLDQLEQLCVYLQEASLCGLGQTAPNPVVSTLKFFRDEYLAHIVDRVCPAGVCEIRPKTNVPLASGQSASGVS